MTGCLFALVCSFLLLLPAAAQLGLAEIAPPTPLLGNWLTTSPQPDGSTVLMYQTFFSNMTFESTLVQRGRDGTLTRKQAQGKFRFESFKDKSCRLTIWPEDWSPRHTCTEGAGCTDVPKPLVSMEDITFSDPDRFHSSDARSVVTMRLRNLPEEAAAPVPHVTMLTASGEPSSAPSPNVPDVAPIEKHGSPSCHELDERRRCELDRGVLAPDYTGCKVCTQERPTGFHPGVPAVVPIPHF